MIRVLAPPHTPSQTMTRCKHRSLSTRSATQRARNRPGISDVDRRFQCL